MSTESLLIFLIVGVIAGWLAGQIVRGGGFGLVGDMVVGVIGSFVGGWLFSRFDLISPASGILGAVIGATVGAVVLLLAIRMVRRVT
jgi:uncharacterized membrane protein YeaQ/YmgE (transglycosylase-associated protein family)